MHVHKCKTKLEMIKDISRELVVKNRCFSKKVVQERKLVSRNSVIETVQEARTKIILNVQVFY